MPSHAPGNLSNRATSVNKLDERQLNWLSGILPCGMTTSLPDTPEPVRITGT